MIENFKKFSIKNMVESAKKLSLLIEKLIIVGKGAKYGQVVFLAGGAGSGKGFAAKNFMEGEKFKIRDVDEWKNIFLRIAVLKKKYKEIRHLKMRNPNDVATLHQWIEKKGIKDKTLTLLLKDARQGRLPNIMFDTTLKSRGKITGILPSLLEAGYDPKNLHVVWVLTNWATAVKQNKDRERVVPAEIMLKTHVGAANTMYTMILSGTPRGLDGGVYIVLGGKEHNVVWTDKSGKPIKTGKNKDTFVIKDFSYLTMKEPGKSMTKEIGLQKQAHAWIMKQAPEAFKSNWFSKTKQEKNNL